jgi:hypothetical protein
MASPDSRVRSLVKWEIRSARSQKVGALARVAPSASLLDQFPVEPQATILVTDGHLIEIGDRSVRGLKPAEHALDLAAVLQAPSRHSRRQSRQTLF